MAFDKPTRNRLSKFVSDARGVIADEFTEQFQSLYGISAKGDIAPLEKLSHLDEAGMATAALLRERIEYLEKTHPDDKDGTKAAVTRLAREQAFTILNRLAAIRMAEKRGLIVESVGKGYQSRGFKVFETVAGSALGDTYHRYRRYLFCLFDELAIDLGALFDRSSPQALLFPREPALLALLDLLHAADLEALWAEDETIGWIYQYYNDPEERKKMRKESAAPRNSRELAVRNQFFTPRYVVEFLTDNTLGRIWYEMTKGQTRLAEQCRYLVRRPTEIFLAEGENAREVPSDQSSVISEESLTQEQLLKQPVYIPHRPLKDPREIRLLDPACGSMHFGLYAFDLFETIYEEAWDNQFCPSLRESYASKEEFMREVPRLIIEHNIHGIDIDPRATQIAALSLWLRAQKAWQQLNLPAVDRPRVRRSNIVCAEPMPGSPEMLEEFVATLNPPLIGELVKTVFDKMQLAGEAGSLLKIEEEIRTAIETARKEWLKQQNDLLTRKDGSQEEFFDTAEQQVIDALRAYAEQADSDSYQRRLFADDAARGFAFIDLCRKHYDAVVMNPPFGEWSVKFKDQSKIYYPSSYNDILAAFVERGGLFLSQGGRVGAITSRTCFFLSSFTKWRDKVVLNLLHPELLVDLGHGVMDAAMVEAASYVLSKPIVRNSMLCFRLLKEHEPAIPLANAIEEIRDGRQIESAFDVDPASFRCVPNAPFAYWVSERIHHMFDRLPPFEADGRVARIGMSTSDDFRFIRFAWETVIESSTAGNTSWQLFAKGGALSAFYADVHLKCLWADNGREVKAWVVSNPTDPRTVHWSRRIANSEHFFRPGLTWPLRTTSDLSLRVIPSGCLFGHKGPCIFVENDQSDQLLTLLAVTNSTPFLSFVMLQLAAADAAARSYEVGVIQRTILPLSFEPSLSRLALQSWEAKRRPDTANQISHAFCAPALGQVCATLAEGISAWSSMLLETTNVLTDIRRQIDDISYRIYQISDRDRRSLEQMLSGSSVTTPESEDTDGETEEELSSTDERSLVVELLSYLTGTAFGRWDIRYATGERQPPELPDPFDSLPVCSPGMLQNDEGLPAEPKDVPADYPLPISWSGILVDDENHPEDIIVRVEDSLKVIWKDRWEAIEQEACENLGVKTLREYFGKPAKFFADHLKRYSKSRRQAPIYWPLSTKSGSYTLWLYYHRLTDQTLHTCLADFLDPKIRKVQAELDSLTGSGGSRVGDLREFLDELKDLHDEIERVIKLPWKPNLNDGVLITASPLHKLFRLPKWQKDLKACWDKLAKGEYDWAHLAHTIWPARVEKACEKDRSLAIAHGLEHLCKIELPKAKKRGKKTEDEDPEEDEPELIEEN